jgi:hypothetical protein
LDGDEGDHSAISARTLNLDLLGSGSVGGVIKHMGFVDGNFRSIGETPTEWGEVGREYHYRIEVHRRLDGSQAPDWVTATLRDGPDRLEQIEIDYSGFPYSPSGPLVRLGLNSHGANWTARNLRVAYLN